MKKYSMSIAAVFMLAVAACGAESKNPSAGSTNQDATPLFTAAHSTATVLPWILDDYESARAEAEKRRIPLFISMWAKWCEPCEKMRRYIFEDGRLKGRGPQFVWLLLDVDNDGNSTAYRLFPVETWPGYFIVNPFDESAAVRQVGYLPLESLQSFLDQGKLEFERFLKDPDKDLGHTFSYVRQGRRDMLQGRTDLAITAFQQALQSMSDRSPCRRTVLLFLLQSLARAGRNTECVSLVRTLPENEAHPTAFIKVGMSCAEQKDVGDARASFFEWVSPRLTALVDESGTTIPDDEKSLAFRLLTAIAAAKNDKAEVAVWVKRHFDFLKTIPLLSSNPSSESSLEQDRRTVYLALAKGDELISLLEERSVSLPHDYRPFYFIGWTALQTGALDKAIESADRAFQMAPDPSRWEVMWLIADIFSARNEPDKELDAIKTLVEYGQTIPEGLLSVDQIQAAEERLKNVERKLREK